MRRLIERPCNTSFPSCLYPNRTPIDIAYMACYSDLGHHSANSPSSQLNFASISRPKALPATFASDYHVIALIAMHTLISEKSPYAPASKYSLSERAMLYLLPKSIRNPSITHPDQPAQTSQNKTPIIRDSVIADTLGSALLCSVHVQRVILKYVMHVSPVIPEFSRKPSSQEIRSFVKCKALQPSSRHSDN